MSKGNPRKPDEMKIVHGTFRKDRQLKGDPPGDGTETFEIPDWITAEAKAELKRMIERVSTWRILAQADIPALAAVAQSLVYVKQAIKEIEVEGLLSSNESGTRVSAAYLVYERSLTQYMSGAAKFGLTSFDRAKIKIEKPVQAENKKVSIR